MNQQATSPSFPVTGWDIGPIPHLKCVALRPHYLSSPMQDHSAPHIGNLLLIEVGQAVQLAHAILTSAKLLESTGPVQ